MAELTWNQCPTCGYLVPAQQDWCARCANGSGSVRPAPPAPASTAPVAPTPPESPPSPSPVVAPSSPPPVPPAGPPSSGAPVGPWGVAPAGRSRRSKVWILVTAVVAAAALIGGALAVGGDDGPSYPGAWDPRIEPVVHQVQRLRGLLFEHPVPVRFATGDDFDDEAAGDGETSAAARRASRRVVEQFRSLGLVSGDVDFLDAVSTSRRSRVLAFYDPDRKEIVVRGDGVLDAPTRAVLAHELTHALQDQHFDLNALQRRVAETQGEDALALRAVIEGDATRIEDLYLESLSEDEQQEYSDWQEAGTSAANEATVEVPTIIEALQGAPYQFGPSVVGVVDSDGGNAAVDRVFEQGAFTQQLFIEPTSSFAAPTPRRMADPKPASAEKRVGSVESFGAFDLYLVLVARLDPATALRAATGWSNGRMLTVRADGTTCVRIVVRGRDRTAATDIAGAWTLWTAGLPADMATVERDGRIVRIHSCDPGAAVTLGRPDQGLREGAVLLEIHNEFEASIVDDENGAGLPVPLARCTAFEFATDPAVVNLAKTPQAEIDAEMVGAVVELVAPRAVDRCLSRAE